MSGQCSSSDDASTRRDEASVGTDKERSVIRTGTPPRPSPFLSSHELRRQTD